VIIHNSPLLGPGLFFSFVIFFFLPRRDNSLISPSQGRYLHTGQHKHRINALSGIRTHDPSVRASEDSSSLRPRCHRVRPYCVYLTHCADRISGYLQYSFLYVIQTKDNRWHYGLCSVTMKRKLPFQTKYTLIYNIRKFIFYRRKCYNVQNFWKISDGFYVLCIFSQSVTTTHL
jgi:hypothetical protein